MGAVHSHSMVVCEFNEMEPVNGASALARARPVNEYDTVTVSGLPEPAHGVTEATVQLAALPNVTSRFWQ